MTGLVPAEAPLPVLQVSGGLLLSLHEKKGGKREGPSSANSLILTYLPPYVSIVVTFLLTETKYLAESIFWEEGFIWTQL